MLSRGEDPALRFRITPPASVRCVTKNLTGLRFPTLNEGGPSGLEEKKISHIILTAITTS